MKSQKLKFENCIFEIYNNYDINFSRWLKYCKHGRYKNLVPEKWTKNSQLILEEKQITKERITIV